MMEEEQRRDDGTEQDGDDPDPRERISEGMRQGLGMLSAFKDALEETIREARERGEFSSERAREVVNDAVARAREAAGEAREKIDFATRQELEEVRETLDELSVRLQNLEQRVPQDPDVGPSRPVDRAEEQGSGM